VAKGTFLKTRCAAAKAVVSGRGQSPVPKNERSDYGFEQPRAVLVFESGEFAFRAIMFEDAYE
jgi:hypothetical protein